MFKNLTPHVLDIHLSSGTVKVPPSGEVARVAEIRTEAEPVEGVPTTATQYGEVTDLPEPKAGIVYIASAIVAQAVRRADVMSPGPLVRDGGGRPVGCRGLTRWAPEAPTEVRTPGGLRLLHADHGIEEAHMRLIDSFFEARVGFVCEAIPLGDLKGTLSSALYGPAAGDPPVDEEEVKYRVRNGRAGPSRLVDLPTRPADHLVVVGVAGGDDPVVFTAYGQRGEHVTPREWWDPSMRPKESASAALFWSHHALAAPR